MLRVELDRLRPLRRALAERIGRSRAPETVAWLIENVLQKRSRPLALELEVARAIGALGPDGAGRLARLLPRTKDPAQLAAILAGLERAGPDARDAQDAVIALLDHEVSAVRERAATALGAMRVARAVGPMITRLEHERGQALNRVATALESLTGQSFGKLPLAWRAWFADHREALLAGELPLGGGPPAERAGQGRRAAAADAAAMRADATARADGSGYYMGIPQDGRSIVYVLDASKSMDVEIDFDTPDRTSSLRGRATRLQACKAELIRALASLTPDKSFDIVFFHEIAVRFREAPVPASPANIAAAQTFVRAIDSALYTNTHDALQAAFAMLAPQPGERALGDGIDTIFLLTDGRPIVLDASTGPSRARADPTAMILQAVADWDPLRRVTIHCIGIGKGLRRQFLTALAKAGGGVARFY